MFYTNHFCRRKLQSKNEKSVILLLLIDLHFFSPRWLRRWLEGESPKQTHYEEESVSVQKIVFRNIYRGVPEWEEDTKAGVIRGFNKSKGAHRYKTFFEESDNGIGLRVTYFPMKFGPRWSPHYGGRTFGYFQKGAGIIAPSVGFTDMFQNDPESLADVAAHEADHFFGREHTADNIGWKPWPTEAVEIESRK